MLRDDMVAFAAEFDPQPMHLDEDAARATMLGGLCASGWFACCILMRMCAEAFVLDSSSMGAPDVDEVRWLKPIRPNDQIVLRATVLDTRASRSRPDMGFVRFSFDLFNQRDEHVVALTTSMMMGRRATSPRLRAEVDAPKARSRASSTRYGASGEAASSASELVDMPPHPDPLPASGEREKKGGA
jgi:acyl dehydratase